MALKEKEKVFTDGALEGQLKAFRNEDRGDSYIVLGYGGTPNVLRVLAEGSGGLNEAKQHFHDNDSFYALLRKDHKVEMAKTVKFVFVDWTSDKVSPLRKAILATHKGQVKKLLEPFHVTLDATSPNELDENEVLARIGMASGTSNFVTTKAAVSNKATGVDALGKVQSAASTSGLAQVPDSIRESRSLNIQNEHEFRDAIRDVRNDSTATNWMIASYKPGDTTTLVLRGKGEGGIEEMLSHMDDSTVWYGIFRMNEQFDKTSNVRFIHFKYLPLTLSWSAMQRAKISTHQGAVRPLFEPFHTDFDIGRIDELSTEIVRERLQSIMGTKNRVLTAEEAQSRQVHSAAASGPKNLVPINSVGSLDFSEGEEAFKQGIKNVRSDANPVNWFVGSYVKANTLSIVGEGTNGFQEMKQAIQPDKPNFALLRVTDIVDKNVTVKFVYIKTLPSGVAPMLKAGLSTKKELLDKLFTPFHVDIFVENINDLKEKDVHDRVSAASGSGSRVLA